jgi:alpha-tubulin suppressor-like RCC1 family protein
MNTSSGYLEDINNVAAGWMHSLVLDLNSFVWAWGDDYWGQLGNGPAGSSTTPVQVHDGEMNTASDYLENIIAISAGRSGRQSLALDANNFVYAWGYNKYGQCGNGVSESNELTPVRVLKGQQDTSTSGYLENILAVSAGADQSMALEKDDPNDPNFNGCVYTWGTNQWGDEDYEQGWIDPGYGLLGTGSNVAIEDMPVKVHGVNDVNFLAHIVAIAAGWDHCMALENDDPWNPNWQCPTCKGRVFTWGNNSTGYGGGQSSPSVGGRLGDGTTTSRSTPVLVLKGQQELSTSNYLEHIVAVSAGEGHSLALDFNGNVYAWGDNQYGQLGNGTNDPCTTPVKVVGPDLNQNGIHEPNEGHLENIIAISAGHWHSIAVDADGTIWTWGKGAGGRLGIGTDANENTPQRVPVVRNITRQFQPSYFRIQPAIDDANDTGDILQASEGTFSESIDFLYKNITLRSTDPNNWSVVEDTIIDGSNYNDNVVKFNNNPVSTLAGFTIAGGYHGISLSSSTANIANCNIRNNTSCGIYSAFSQPIVSNCIIEDNTTNGIYDSYAPATTIKNNIIRGNDANGIFCEKIAQNVEIEINNNLIYNNGNNGIYISNPEFYAPAIIRNNTIVNNDGYGINSLWPEDANVINCIIWGNNSGQEQLYTEPAHGNFDKLRYSCIQNGDTNNCNINTDPLFYDDPNNFHLSSTSPCIDTGDLNFTSTDETDIDGEDRVKDGDANVTEIVDMGADEFYWSRADFNKDEFVNFVDYAKFALSWQSSLGEPDYNDICDLEDNNSIDYADLAMFCEDWLWQAAWTQPVGFMMMSQGMGEITAAGFASAETSLQSVSEEQKIEKVEPFEIKKIIDWLEQLWLDEETQKLIDEDTWLKFIESVKEEL